VKLVIPFSDQNTEGRGVQSRQSW